ncbi:MAG: LbtU family siderophore porin [Deltaproteobacteria bacterium]|nr:LbtU family siderophore porin [Deltaproteobacteria bacterium]MBW2074652.1 LbtU family siderophore porin [Deltaproteobacteria bacterium]
MKKHGWIFLGVTFFWGLFFIAINAYALSPETALLLKLLEKKGVITQEEGDALRQEVEAAAPPALDKEAIKAEIKEEITQELKDEGGPLAGIQDNITISGAVEVDYQYLDHRDRTDKGSDGTSDIYASTIELGIQAQVNESTTANIIFKAEDVDKSTNAANNNDGSDPDNPFIDEATITIYNPEKCPFYAVLGKRGQPFGNFFTHTVSDPVTKTAYEVATTGATVGFAPADFYDLDVAFTAYKGEKLINALNGAGTGWARSNTAYAPTDDVSSYIASLSLKPIEALTLGVAFDSEPGDGDRNETFNASAELLMFDVILDGEYFVATSREKHLTDDKTYKEKAWVVGLAYHVVDPLELSVRFEKFDVDHDSDQDGDFDYIFAFGANYELLQNVTLMGEYRRVVQETAAGSTYEETVNEYNLRVAVGF